MRYNVNKDDAGYSVSSALRVGGIRRPRLTARNMPTDTLCTRADGSTYIIPARTSGSRAEHKRSNARAIAAVDAANKQRRIVTAANLAPIGNIE